MPPSGMRKNLCGDRGEKAFDAMMLRPSGPDKRVYFQPEFLGAKAGLMDFLVRLLDENEGLLGPFFFAQVKTTESRKAVKVARLDVKFSKRHVLSALKIKIPCYVVGVDASDPATEKLYVCGIHSSRKTAIPGVQASFDLSLHSVREKLYLEVVDFFNSSSFSHTSVFAAAGKARKRK